MTERNEKEGKTNILSLLNHSGVSLRYNFIHLNPKYHIWPDYNVYFDTYTCESILKRALLNIGGIYKIH